MSAYLLAGLLQLFLPLILLGLQPRARNGADWLCRQVLALAWLVALAAAGLWTWLIYWLPWVMLAVALLSLLRSAPKALTLPLWPQTRPARLGLGLRAALASLGLAIAMHALSGWIQPPGPAVNLSLPLGPGSYYVANGGSVELINAHLKTRDGERYRAWRGQSYAVDLLALDAWGQRASGFLPTELSRYRIFGREVLAPCSGRVREAVTNRPDLLPPATDSGYLAGNHVLLECGELLVLLAHLSQHSLTVREGQQVRTGQLLGRVGNSGNTTEPHLHLHAQYQGSRPTSLDGEPVWLRLEGRFPVRNQILIKRP